jgi:DNA-directed RNA polymerase specialized sigma24 family protein
MRAWLYRAATNLAINRLKSASHRADAQAAAAGVAEPPETVAPTDVEREAAQRQFVRIVLRRLPEPMRQCLLLSHAGLSGAEIAEVVGVKPSYVGTLVFRGHERFRLECEALGFGGLFRL